MSYFHLQLNNSSQWLNYNVKFIIFTCLKGKIRPILPSISIIGILSPYFSIIAWGTRLGCQGYKLGIFFIYLVIKRGYSFNVMTNFDFTYNLETKEKTRSLRSIQLLTLIHPELHTSHALDHKEVVQKSQI